MFSFFINQREALLRRCFFFAYEEGNDDLENKFEKVKHIMVHVNHV